jgi:GT2 family glycosyltransferase
MVVRASSFKEVGGFNPRLVAAEDQDFFQRLRKIDKAKTHFESSLRVYHTGRRAHKIGWPRLISIWIANGFSQRFFGRSVSKEWKEVR